jgi:hypothetical protein
LFSDSTRWRLHLLRRYSRMQVGEREFFGLRNSGIANHRHRTFTGQAGPFTVKELLSGLVCPKAKVLISQCSSRTPSFIRIMSVAITGRPTPENRLVDAYVRFATKHSALIGLMFAAKH